MCDICGKALSSKQALAKHRMLHTDERPYKCDFPGCDVAFTQGVQLKNHKSSHLRKQGLVAPDDHQCERCGKYLATRSALNSHIMTVHDKVSMEVKCKHCEEVFTNKAAMTRHKNRVHFPNMYSCDVCNKSFGCKSMLTKHARVHLEAQFECQECGKRLKSRETLEDHVRLHTGEKPFSCPYCVYSCQSFTVLNNHKKYSHKLEFEVERLQKMKDRIRLPPTD